MSKPELKRQNTTSRRAKLDESGEEVVVAGCFTRNVLKCPCVVMWGCATLCSHVWS
jgi:hypothetical protein